MNIRYFVPFADNSKSEDMSINKTPPFLQIFLLIALFAMPFLFSACTSSGGDAEKPNVVLIFADDMGYGDLSCYGHPIIKTPHLDQMADDGIRFTSFYVAASVCTPSRAALLTGRYPSRHLPHNLGPRSEGGLPLEEITVADILKDQGYNTMAIGKWHLGLPPAYLPTSRGFDSFYGLPYSNDMILPWCPWLSEDHRLFLYSDTTRVREIGYEQDDLSKMYTEKALEFIEENKDQPFFLYLAHSMPHLPISTSEEFRGKSKAGLYGDVIQTIDWSVGQILEILHDLNLVDKTMVIFTSDNGPWHNLPERMLQRGVEHWHAGSTGPLRGAKATTYEGGFRVPAIIRWPGVIPDAQVSDEIVCTMDLFTTIIKLAGGELPSDRVIDGQDAIQVLKGEGPSQKELYFYLAGNKVQAVRKGAWKLRHTESDGIQLFNLETDHSEMYNRAGEFPDLVDELYLEMEKFSTMAKANIDKLN